MPGRMPSGLFLLILLLLSPLTLDAKLKGWTAQDIGSVAQPGQSDSAVGGRLILTGAGSGIGGQQDSFHFCFQKMAGDFELIVRLVRNHDETAPTGIMLRESLDPGARYELLTADSTERARGSYRLRSGSKSETNSVLRLGWQPCWLKLTRCGDQVGLWYSPDQITWHYSRFGGTLQNLAREVYVGMVRTAGKNGKGTEAEFDHVSLKPLDWPYRTSWVGNSLPGGNTWVQAGVLAMYVEPDTGKAFLSGPDEKFGTSVYDADGRHLGYGERSHFAGGGAIVADDKSFYHAQNLKEGKRNGGLCRYDHQGSLAGPPSVALEGHRISGLAVHGDTLYAADEEDNCIRVLRKSDLHEDRSFAFDRPGNMAADADGNLWIVRPRAGSVAGQVVHYRPDGTKLPQEIVAVDTPRGLAIHPKTGQIYVADSGARQQVLIFNSNGSPAGSFGAEGGIYSRFGDTVPGQVHPLKLNHPVGVGVDRQGNLYVASNGPKAPWAGGTGTELRKFDPSGKMLWARYGLEYVDCGDVDPGTDGADVFTKEQHYVIDYSKPTGQEWSYRGMTFDPYRYPDDPRVTQAKPGATLIRRIAGQRIMFLTSMGGEYLYYYRFTPDSEIAIPCGGMAKDRDGHWYRWSDRNGNGRIDAGEEDTTGPAADRFAGWFVDADGGIWFAGQQQGVRYYRCQNLDAHGAPLHAATPETWSNPAEFSGAGAEVTRVQYVPATDTLYLGGYSAQNPKTGADWGQLGTEIIRYDHWRQGPRTLVWRCELPYMPKVKEGHESYIAKAMSVAGDRLFVAESATSMVRVYDTRDGKPVLTMFAGPEVAGIVALVDMNQGINAYCRANGEYVILLEEDSRAKVLMFRWDGQRRR